MPGSKKPFTEVPLPPTSEVLFEYLRKNGYVLVRKEEWEALKQRSRTKR